MDNLMTPFDPTKFDPSQGEGNLPVGFKQPVAIVAHKLQPSRNGSSGMLNLTLQVLDGPNKGAKGPLRLNLYHSNPQTVEIAHRRLSTICYAVGFVQVLTNPQQIYNRPFLVDIELQSDAEAASKGYTEVTHIYDAQGNEPGKQPAQAPAGFAAPTQQPAQAPASAPAAPAWGQPPAAGAASPAAPAWGQQTPPAAQAPQWGNPGAASQPAWAK